MRIGYDLCTISRLNLALNEGTQHGTKNTSNDLRRRRQNACGMGHGNCEPTPSCRDRKGIQGWFAADISEKRDVLIREFDPNAEILLIPRVQGGR
jgi:hypothetical protein